ncbi:T9SS type A sorting domain-containing protein [Kaistella flava (ex Peng et al. 2021)]|uniref:T9SS type A sorting domain-containing protein n=1 Tax=Kaistella flava (ex Peng et al. 2021) TaxID=2038776 RepID=A0A7M2Y9T2_9FLAO|nr:T9SS type A sorting domain-containing protein [Kaistella flava (ex Peng et al. 2021)]QOW10172.1 T9SS type A sorting domain-containing protein [Kaistella flava (ex Peng et al. 2021)]
MKKLYIGVLFLFAILSVSAQETKTLWQKDIKSSTQDFLSTMSITLDRQIVLSGSAIQKSKLSGVSTSGATSTNAGYDYRLLKLSQEGNILWDKHFGGSKHDYLVSTTTTREGGFLLTGTSYSNQSLDKKDNNIGGADVWLIRLNEDGEELWQKTLGTKNNDEAAAVTQSLDEGFFVAGNINSNKNLFGSKDIFISKLDKTGKLINTTILGGNALDEVQEMIATPDGGSVLLMYSTSGKTENKIFNPLETDEANTENKAVDLLASLKPKTDNQQSTTIFGKTEENFGEGDYWIVKLDKNANVEWQKTYGGSADDHPKTIVFTDKGYLIGGESRSNSSGNKRENIEEGTDLWLISLDKNGNELWQKTYSFGNRDVLMSANVIRKTNKDNFSEDKGFLLGGYTQAEGKIQTDDEKFWMLYINAEGKEEWRKHVEGTSKKKEERLVSAKLQTDGTFLLAGTSAEELGQENWKILKLGDKDLDNLLQKQDIRIYPNPVDDYAYVEIGFELKGEAQITLHDMSGRQIQKIKTKNKVTKIDTAALPQGVYIVTAKTPNKSVNTKIVKK